MRFTDFVIVVPFVYVAYRPFKWKHMKLNSIAVVVALPLVCAAVPASGGGGLQEGVFVSRTSFAPTPGLEEDFDYGAVPATYQASVTSNSATLNWLANGSNFVGTCNGATNSATSQVEVTGRSQSITLITLATASTFSINYSMSNVVRVGNEVSWALVDTNTGNPMFGLQFDGTAATAFGGVLDTSATGSFASTASAGTYWLLMLAECDNLGGSFSYDATFSAVPAPGALSALIMAAALRGRRRR